MRQQSQVQLCAGAAGHWQATMTSGPARRPRHQQLGPRWWRRRRPPRSRRCSSQHRQRPGLRTGQHARAVRADGVPHRQRRRCGGRVRARVGAAVREPQPHEHAGKFPLAQHLFACLPNWSAHTNVTLGIKTRSPSPVALHDLEHSSERAPLGHNSAYCKPAPALVQELTRHAANLGMLAAATANSLRSKHFYLGFQVEHRLTATGAQLPMQSNSIVAVLCSA